HFKADETATEVVGRVAAEWPPDVLLCGCPEVLPPPREVERCPIKTVALLSDWNLYQPQLEHNLARFDIVLSDRLAERELCVWGARPHFVQPLYAHRTLVHRPLEIDRDIDVLFLGNLNHAIHRERGRMLEIAARLSDEYRVLIDAGYPPEDYARHLNRARIVVNHAVRREMNLRCFEAPVCGALLFFEDANLEAGDYLADGEQAVRYNAGNLEGLLRTYLDDEEKRAAVARAGRERIAGLAIERRLDDLFDWMEVQPRGARRFLELPEAVRALADVMLYASSLETEQRALAAALLGELLGRDRTPPCLMAAGCMLFEEAALGGSPDAAKTVRACVDRFQEAAQTAPTDAAPWFNLAVVARQANAGIAELECLRRVLDAHDVALSPFALGKVTDPYYAAWRLALGRGAMSPALLQAAAAARLAECALERGDNGDALEFARQSIMLRPEIAVPYRWAAMAHTRAGANDEAARLLEVGLPHTAFDVDYRLDLVSAYRALGRHDTARALAIESARIFQACPPLRRHAIQFRSLAVEDG
ncbi:MAG TPA: glycosyltransferase, partial [Candidatus Hydrogenedentes bacterium]|nr:glycosyltransferase [Candidatus Hydrogenedentota bacterium]